MTSNNPLADLIWSDLISSDPTKGVQLPKQLTGFGSFLQYTLEGIFLMT